MAQLDALKFEIDLLFYVSVRGSPVDNRKPRVRRSALD